MVGGVFISIIFGANEGFFKNRINEGLAKNVKIQSIQVESIRLEKIKTEAEKNWRYYQRYHFHANGIASMTLALLIFLCFIQAPKKQLLFSAYMISVGGFLYPFVWLFAAIYGPEMGRDQAKEAFAIFGYMGGLFLVGILFTLYLAITKPLKVQAVSLHEL
jgi:hypothetical protein